MLLNPITLKHVTIQSPHVTTELQDLGHSNCAVFGFGYDSCSDDFKIVQISHYGLATSFVNVYSVRNGVWKRLVDGCYPYGEFFPYGTGVFMNGALHYLVCSEEGYRHCITAFDLANEVFREIPLPKRFVRQLDNDVYGLPRMGKSNGVFVVGGCLLIVDSHGNGATDIWIMKEYGVEESWVKFCIEYEEGDYNWSTTIVAALFYVEDGELLCLTCRNFLLACDLKWGTARRVVLGGCDVRCASGMSFVDSLVSPEGYLYEG